MKRYIVILSFSLLVITCLIITGCIIKYAGEGEVVGDLEKEPVQEEVGFDDLNIDFGMSDIEVEEVR